MQRPWLRNRYGPDLLVTIKSTYHDAAMHGRVCLAIEYTLDSLRVMEVVPQELGPYRAWVNNSDWRPATLKKADAQCSIAKMSGTKL